MDEPIKRGQLWARNSDDAPHWVRVEPFGSHGWVKVSNADGRVHEVSETGLRAKYYLVPGGTELANVVPTGENDG